LIEAVKRTLNHGPHGEDHASEPPRTNIPVGLTPPHEVLASSSKRRGLAFSAIAFLMTVVGVLYVTRSNQGRPPAEFAAMAVDTHVRHLRGQLPFEITSDSPEQISDWFAGKVSFGLKLPNYQEPPGEEKPYRLEGARLVAFKNDYAAYVAYKMRNRPISLVVTSESIARASGGEEIVSKEIVFHYDSIDGLKVITWADRGLTYALVSDLEERGQQSCIVCHMGSGDRVSIEGLESIALRR